MRPSRLAQGRATACAILSLSLLATTNSGCSYITRSEPLAEPVELIAVLPLDRAEPAKTDEDRVRLAPNAERIVTGQIYSVLAESPRWRFAADLTVSDALRRIDKSATRDNRARQLGKAVGAEAVLSGEVSRFIERVGTEYGARAPAAVSFSLQLISVNSGEVLWQGDFDKTQEPLSSNLFNWWMFWEAGPRWLSAAELAQLGVQHLLEELDRRMPE